MSWRLIFAILLVGLGVSAWGGLQLGDWLVAHGPVASATPDHPELSTVPVLDADGKPFLAQPPQPLMDGRQGVPEPPTEIAWQVAEPEAPQSNPNIDVATTPITMEEAINIATGGGDQQTLQGIADVSGSDLAISSLTAGSFDKAQRNQPLQPIEMAPPPPPPAPAPTAASSGSWQASLRQDLQACSALGFFDRPSCAWAARNKYCAPNNAWGKVRDCPAKSF